MAGGAIEYMASYVSGSYTDAGFTSTTIANYNSKYFDVYSSSSIVTSFNNRILGDATGEIGPFYYYQDTDGTSRYHNSREFSPTHFIDSTYSWFR